MHFDPFNLQHRPDMVLKGWSKSARAAKCLTPDKVLGTLQHRRPLPKPPLLLIKLWKDHLSQDQGFSPLPWARGLWASGVSSPHCRLPVIAFIPAPGMYGWAAGLQHKYLHLKKSCMRRSHLVFFLPVLLLASSWKVVKSEEKISTTDSHQLALNGLGYPWAHICTCITDFK